MNEFRKPADLLRFRLLAVPLVLSCALVVLPMNAAAAEPQTADNPLRIEGSWTDLREDILGEILPAPAMGVIDLEAPYRAHDAATVPVRIKQPSPNSPAVDRAFLIIDENPAPVAAEMTFGKAMHPLDLEFRVRVNQYSNVRVVAETDKGTVMAGRFVKASGGCSAPATKSPELALSQMGTIRAKHFLPDIENSSNRREAQIMIRHPNYSGLQRDQVTQLFISAHFVNFIEVKQGEDTLFTLEGGISLSENPVIRFAYTDNGTDELRIRAEDTDGNVWEEVITKGKES
ncbi:quinoprotein dehydrogenase-associated SoxYZ-like carrier [Roseibium marinum]|uniref:Sulfur-oxidizing protein SoxY n=1 Tax=Roseibium marinum TaxID=281252 RepID=A0A2S3UKU8_9HYPH|nr:quinoprotein dehydrogenase-associated SoxYZ-like carrier [Roseibium marinum]POF28326.1 sulfur-oxidizing protein SoxY [Roseibium marinum]